MTSEGGNAITLAESGAKSAATAVTSFAGKEFTIVTSAVASATSSAGSNNGALGSHSTGLAPVVASVFTVVGGAFIGAFVAL